MSPSLNLQARIRAGLVHLAVCAVTALMAYILVFHLWFPAPFHKLAGGHELFWLIVCVDVIVGPILTTIVFDKAKAGKILAVDVSIIGAFQFVALCYGLNISYQARPVALVFEVDRFRVICAADVLMEELSLAPPDLRSLPKFSFWTLGTRKSMGAEVAESVYAALGGYDIAQRPSYWQSYEISRSQVLLRARPVLELLKVRDREGQQILTAAVESLKIPINSARFLPLTSQHQSWVVILDEHGNPAKFAPVDGFLNNSIPG